MAINTNYNNYNSTLFNTTSTSSSSNNYNDFYKLLSSSQSASRASYGKNTAQALPQSAQDFLTGAKKSSESLKSTLNSLLGKTKTGFSSFDEKTAKSNNEEYLTVKSIDSEKSTDTKPIDVDIEQLAQSQKNIGTSLKASEKSFTEGSEQSFEIEANGKKTVVSFYASAKDTNKEIQQKMADAINAKKLGVTASVSLNAKDPKNVTSSLTLESSTTGINKEGQNNFSIKDYTGSSAVAKLGVADVDQKAQNAKFRVNGGSLKESKSNDANIGNGITATLKKVTTNLDSSVQITSAKDTTAPLNKVRELINGFNGLMESTMDNKGDRRTDLLSRELSGMTSAYQAGLSRIGVSSNKSGYLQIDEAKMKKAAESGDLEKFFTSNGNNSSYGFANRLAKTAENVSKNTAEYVTTKSTNSYSNSFNQSKYNSLMNTGLLFNAMF